jgi:hypothetical protein
MLLRAGWHVQQDAGFGCNRGASTHSAGRDILLLLSTIYSRYLKRVISQRDGREYLKQVPSSDGSLELI